LNYTRDDGYIYGERGFCVNKKRKPVFAKSKFDYQMKNNGFTLSP